MSQFEHVTFYTRKREIGAQLFVYFNLHQLHPVKFIIEILSGTRVFPHLHVKQGYSYKHVNSGKVNRAKQPTPPKLIPVSSQKTAARETRFREAKRSSATPPGWNAGPSLVTPQHFVKFPWQFSGAHSYSWVARGTVRVMSLAQEYNTMTLARIWKQTFRSAVQHTNY